MGDLRTLLSGRTRFPVYLSDLFRKALDEGDLDAEIGQAFAYVTELSTSSPLNPKGNATAHRAPDVVKKARN